MWKPPEYPGPCFDLHFDRFDGLIFEAEKPFENVCATEASPAVVTRTVSDGAEGEGKDCRRRKLSGSASAKRESTTVVSWNITTRTPTWTRQSMTPQTQTATTLCTSYLPP